MNTLAHAKNALNLCKEMKMSDRVRTFIIKYLEHHILHKKQFASYDVSVSEMCDDMIVRALGEDFDIFWDILELKKDRKQDFVSALYEIIDISQELHLFRLQHINIILLSQIASDIGILEFLSISAQ